MKEESKKILKKKLMPDIDKKRILNPAMWFANTARSAKFFMFTSGILLVMLFLQPVFIQIASAKKQNVIIMDPTNTYHVAAMVEGDQANQMFNSISAQAVEAFFDRNPEGFDKPLLLKQIFINPGYQYAKKDFEKQLDEFKQKKIHQKVEVDKIIIQEATTENVQTLVKGQLIQTGIDDGAAYQQGYEFVMQLLMVRNPELGNGRLPYCVWQVKYKLRKIKANDVTKKIYKG